MGSIVPVLPTGAAGLEDQQSSTEERHYLDPQLPVLGAGAALPALSLWWRRLQEPAGRLPIVTATSLRE